MSSGVREHPYLCIKAVGPDQLCSHNSVPPPLHAERFGMERLASALDAPMGTVKSMVFKKKAVLSLTPEDISDRIRTLAEVVNVSKEGPVPYHSALRPQ